VRGVGPATISAVGRSYRIPLPALAGASLVLVTGALLLVFFVVPNDLNQGFSQRIFYFHVSIAFTAYACFAAGAWKAFVHLWKRDPRADLESYVAIHQGVIFGVLVLVTGSIWARISWGHWWLWSENQLVLFLVLFLFYAAYFMLRFSVDPGPQRAPVCRLRPLRRRPHTGQLPRDPPCAEVHPPGRVHAPRCELRRLDAGRLLRLAGCVAHARVHALSARALRQTARHEAARAAQGVRVTTAEKYVTAAYCAIFAVVLLYVVIIALKLQRLEREVDALQQRSARERDEDQEREPVQVG